MDKVVIFNVFDFLSFHICKALLDKGIEVTGIQIEEVKNENYLEDKKLEIGRNANYSELLFTDLTNNALNEREATIIFSIYDLYMLYKESILQKEAVTNPLINFFNRQKNSDAKSVFLVPCQLLTKLMDVAALAALNDFLAKTKAANNNIQLLYLPTIYGPWQPETFIFQHSILTNMQRNREFKGIREETMDAIFIEDTVKSLIEIIEKRTTGSYLLESEEKDQWNLCASYVQVDENLFTQGRKISEVNEPITKISVKRTTPISTALTKQIDHTRRYYS